MKKVIVMLAFCLLSVSLFAQVTETHVEYETIEMALVKAGTFDMGSNNGEKREKPVHKVTLTKDYYIGTYEVTQEQYYKVMNKAKPSSNSPAKGWENLPVTHVNWYDAVEFCNALSKMEGLEPYYSINGTNVTSGILCSVT